MNLVYYLLYKSFCHAKGSLQLQGRYVESSSRNHTIQTCASHTRIYDMTKQKARQGKAKCIFILLSFYQAQNRFTFKVISVPRHDSAYSRAESSVKTKLILYLFNSCQCVAKVTEMQLTIHLSIWSLLVFPICWSDDRFKEVTVPRRHKGPGMGQTIVIVGINQYK